MTCASRARISKAGKIKIKEICTGAPSLIGVENMGTKDSPIWHYKFKIESQIHGTVEILLSSSGFSSNLTFKKSIMRKIPVLFSGSNGDFDLNKVVFLRKIIKKRSC